MHLVSLGHGGPYPEKCSNEPCPAYSDASYSGIPAAVTVFWSQKGSPNTENPGYSDIPLSVTLFGRPNTVTVSGQACS